MSNRARYQFGNAIHFKNSALFCSLNKCSDKLSFETIYLKAKFYTMMYKAITFHLQVYLDTSRDGWVTKYCFLYPFTIMHNLLQVIRFNWRSIKSGAELNVFKQNVPTSIVFYIYTANSTSRTLQFGRKKSVLKVNFTQ